VENPIRVLVVDDEPSVGESLRLLLKEEGAEVFTLTHPSRVIPFLKENPVDLIFCDLRMPRISGWELFRSIKEEFSHIPVLLMSAYGTEDTAQEFLLEGGWEYIKKPITPQKIHHILQRIKESRISSVFAPIVPRKVPDSFRLGEIIGQHPLMRNVFEMIRKVAPYPTTVLIEGESGVGKELVAREIHRLSARREGPFVPVNCGAIPSTLLESELFGYKKGAFTGADRDRTGLIVEASGGTLFLDEIGELPPDLQVELLRVLQEGKVQPLGTTHPIEVDVRWISATLKDLKSMVQEGKFRSDLYYRLNVISIYLPPLRKRKEDIPLIVEETLYRLEEKYGKKVKGVESSAVELLLTYPFYGNVRELINVLERAYILTEGEWITREALAPFLVLREENKEEKKEEIHDLSIPKAVRELEIRYIREALRRTGGNKTRAAQLLNISLRALQYKIKEYQIE